MRKQVLAAITRITKAEALAGGAPQEPLIEHYESTDSVYNDPALAQRLRAPLEATLGKDNVITGEPITPSEDYSFFVEQGVPSLYMSLGGADPRKLAEPSHPRIQASRGEIAKSLEGNWRQELLFVLQQEIEMYDTYQRRIAECDQQLQQHLARFADTVPSQAKEEVPQKKKRAKKPPTTNRVRQKESRPTRPTGHTSQSVKLSIKKFLESRVTGQWTLGRFQVSDYRCQLNRSMQHHLVS